MTSANVAFFDEDDKFHHARNPKENSLSATYNSEAAADNYLDKAAREDNFHEYLTHGASQSVTKLIENCLWEMEVKNIPMTDTGLFETIFVSPDYTTISESIRKILDSYGVTRQNSSANKPATTVTFPKDALLHFGV